MREKSSGFIHLLPLILVGILIAGVGAGMYWLGKSSGQPIITKSSPTPVGSMEPQATGAPQATAENTNCLEGYITYSNEFFRLCQPNGMTYQENFYTTPVNETAVVVKFENTREIIQVTTSFQGGWGGGTCDRESFVIDGNKTTVLVWDDNGGETCTSNIVNLVAVVGEWGENENKQLPVAIDYQRKGEDFLSRKVFDDVLNSFKLK